MDLLVALARLLLAGVFLISGVGKLVDLAGSEKAMRGFGAPEPLAKPGGVALPLAELSVAILLLPATATLGGVLALLLLVAFVGAVGYKLSGGRRPDCHCFGQLHAKPIGWRTMATGGVLTAAAFFVAAGGLAGRPGPSLVGWTGRLSVLEAAALVVGVLLAMAATGIAWLLVHLLGQNGRLLVRLDKIEEALAEHNIDIPEDEKDAAEAEEEGLPYGSPAPAFTLTGVHGETMTLDALRARGKPILLVFSDPGCKPCNALMPDIGRWQRELATKMTVAVIAGGDVAAVKAKSDEHGLINVLLQKESGVSELYRSYGALTGILVRADGAIGSKAAVGAEDIRKLATQIVEDRAPATVSGRTPAAPRPTPQSVADVANVGQPAPAVSLPDLDGRMVTLAELKGQPTVLLFWSPSCGFCQQMLPDVKAWEEDPPKGAPKLMLVSSGSAEENREQGLHSPILLDQSFGAASAFGAVGTPSAIMVDARGNIASKLAVGPPSVLRLLNPIDPAGCAACVADCKERGGGEACVAVCVMAGACE
jgi:peroxiredoxin